MSKYSKNFIKSKIKNDIKVEPSVPVINDKLNDDMDKNCPCKNKLKNIIMSED